MGRIFFSNLLQKRNGFDETAPPFVDRILPKSYLSGDLHVIKSIRSEQDYFGTLHQAGRKCPAFSNLDRIGRIASGILTGAATNGIIVLSLVFLMIMPYIGKFFCSNIT